jgi:tRNA modification GTPase
MAPARNTIFALSSGPPPAAIAVIRISGPDARTALEKLSGRVPQPRQAALARLRDPESSENLDEALALWFPAPRSETGEDMAELQLHGGRAVIASVLAALARLPGFRPAEPGEFTRRAFENGRMDLTAVEGLADLIGAETEAQRRQAYRQMKGLLGNQAETWRGRLIDALALVEAGIDFSDEADVPAKLIHPALEIARGLHADISAALVQAGHGERLRDGFVVAIAGPPNAGKSTLLNRIAKREAAIVSPFAGTTRDVIEVHLDLGGYPVTLLDTAGVRETEDPVEQEGVRRARMRAAEADLVLWVTEVGQPMAEFSGQWPSESRSAAHSGVSMGQGDVQSDAPARWVVQNKLDLLSSGSAADRNIGLAGAAERNESSLYNEYKFISISAHTGMGLENLLQELQGHVAHFFGRESSLISRERHRAHLREAQAALVRALEAPADQEEIIAEELRLAARDLGRLTGKVDVEDILDVIFRDFCIGK